MKGVATAACPPQNHLHRHAHLAPLCPPPSLPFPLARPLALPPLLPLPLQTRQLTELVFQLRSEADGLRTQLAASASAAQAAEASTAEVQQAAAEWRRQGEEGLEVAAQERARSAALQAEVERLGAELQAVRSERDEQRRRRKAADAEVARLQTDGSGPALVAELRSRCAQERAWRKAVCRYLEGEMHAKAELERVLLNVGTSLRVGDTQPRTAAAPPLPPRHATARQLVRDMPPPPAVTVTVVHSPVHGPSLGAAGVAAAAAGSSADRGSSGRDPAGWRQHFKETMAAFDERHAKLQSELSGLKREALPPGP